MREARRLRASHRLRRARVRGVGVTRRFCAQSVQYALWQRALLLFYMSARAPRCAPWLRYGMRMTRYRLCARRDRRAIVQRRDMSRLQRCARGDEVPARTRRRVINTRCLREGAGDIDYAMISIRHEDAGYCCFAALCAAVTRVIVLLMLDARRADMLPSCLPPRLRGRTRARCCVQCKDVMRERCVTLRRWLIRRYAITTYATLDIARLRAIDAADFFISPLMPATTMPPRRRYATPDAPALR